MRLSTKEVFDFHPEFTTEKIKQGWYPVAFRIWGNYTLNYLFACKLVDLDEKIDESKPVKFTPIGVNDEKAEFYLYANDKNSNEPYTGRYGVVFIRANHRDFSVLGELAKFGNVFDFDFTNDLYLEQKFIAKRTEVMYAFANDPAHKKVMDTWSKHGTPEV